MKIARYILAGLCCFLVLGITLPNLGRIELPTHTIRYGWPDVICVAVILLPFAVVVVGINYSKVVEGIGWVLMGLLLALRFSG
jgi:hypothetical protein